MQFLWRLQHSVKINGADEIKDAEQRNKTLAEALGASPTTRNIAQLLRLPGTINHPNAKKRKAGRVKCRAELIDYSNESYALSEFPSGGTTSEKDRSKSGLFMSEVCKLFKRSWSIDRIERELKKKPRRYAHTSASRYDNEGRLREQIEACFARWDKPERAAPRAHTNESGLAGLPTANTITPRDTDWDWWPYIAREKLFWIASKGGVGKGLLASHIAALKSRGGTWPLSDQRIQPRNVLWLESEDNVETTVVPRLIAAKADMRRIAVFERKSGYFQGLTSEEIERRDVGLIVLSPLLSYLDVKNFRDEMEVRAALEELSSKIRGLPCTILALLHPNKKVDLGAIERLLGSVAFANFVRSVVLLKAEDDDVVRFVHSKFNLSLRGDDLLFVKQNREPIKHPRGQYVGIDWEKAEENIDPATAFDTPKVDEGDASAGDWLLDFLKDKQWHDVTEIFAKGEMYSHGKETLKKAKARRRSQIVHRYQGEASGAKNLLETQAKRLKRRYCKSVMCVSAWNKDPVFGVIGIQSGPPGLRVHTGFQDYGSRGWDADCGDDCEDPPGVFCTGQVDQGDLS